MISSPASKKTRCKNNITRILLEEPSAKFFVSGVVYGYDLVYSLELEDGTKASVNLPEQLLQVAQVKFGIDYNSQSGTMMSGKNMYAGFNGLPTKQSLAGIIDQFNAAKIADITGITKEGKQLNEQSGLEITDIVLKEYLK